MGLIDRVGAYEDLKQKKIVANLPSVFIKDPLRILRALRFCVEFNFTIEEETQTHLFKEYNHLKEVSIERIRDEVLKILLLEDGYQILDTYHEIFFSLIPELRCTFGFQQNHLVSLVKKLA